MRVSAIIPARNAATTLGRTLEALADQDLDESYEVIVVDNGSTDGTADLAERSSGRITVIRQDNEGPAAGRNRGVAAAGGRALAFTDADCVPDRAWLRIGLTAIDDHHDLVQGRVMPDPDAPRGPFDRSLSVERDTGLYQTANLFVTREAFVRAGGFQSWVAPTSDAPFGEDVLFGWCVLRAGGQASFAPQALVHHAVFPRNAKAFVREHWRRQYFADMTAAIPELRRTFLFARVFLDRTSASFDLALAGLLGAAIRRSPLPLLLALPYGAGLHARVRRWGRYAPRVAVAYGVADAVSFLSLAYGSLRSRTPVF